MGALSLVGTGLTPKNSTKAGNTIMFKVRDSAGPTSPLASPEEGGSNAGLVITNAQLLVMAPRGNLRKLLDCFTNAVPNTGLVAGAQTQATARALLNSQDSSPTTPTVLLTNRAPRARVSIAPTRYLNTAGTGARPTNRIWTVDASVDASGKPTLVVRASFVRTGVPTPVSPYTCPNDAIVTLRYESQITGR